MVKMNMETKYRIVADKYAGYEAQVWRWYWPFWCVLGVDTYDTIKKARRFIDENTLKYRTKVIEYYTPEPKMK
jgi:hypothetical protein